MRALALLLLLTGCGTVQSIVGAPPVVYDDTYTRAEIDAINAEIACRDLARSQLQAARCGVRR